MSALALYLAGLCDYRDKLSPGEKGVVLLFAPDLKQAKVALDYAEGALQATPLMRQLLAARTADTLTLTNGIRLEVRSASFRRIRGMTAVAALADKCAFWKSEDSANPDVEILKCSTPSSSHDTGAWIVMEYDVEQRVMNVNVAVVVDQAELAKLVHEQTHSRPGGPDHFGECALAYFYFCGFGFSFRGEIARRRSCLARRFSLELKS